MVPLPKPDVILTHESDLDGLLSALLLQRLARHLFNEQVPVQAFHNHNWRQRALNERAAWVCDFGFESRLDRPGWVVVDHHPYRYQPQQAQLIHDPTKSASLLCHELFESAGLATDATRRLTHLSNVGDLFLENDPDFAVAGDYANLVKHYGFWPLYHLTEGDPERLLNHPLLDVMRVKRTVEDPIGLSWSRPRVTAITPTIGLVDTLVGNTNWIIHQMLLDPANPYPVLITLFRRGTAGYMASLRSRNGSALAAAEKLQGGGHPNASGASLPRSVQTLPDAVTYLRQILHPPAQTAPAPTGLTGLFDAAKF